MFIDTPLGVAEERDPSSCLPGPSARDQELHRTRFALSSHPRCTSTRQATKPTSPTGPGTAAAAQRELAGSPAPLAALHQQASRLLGSTAALQARIEGKPLRGYPIVINAWASWCTPCRSEFGLFANASAHYGRQVAFLGADTSDSPSDAQSFLAQHPVSYPSYQSRRRTRVYVDTGAARATDDGPVRA